MKHTHRARTRMLVVLMALCPMLGQVQTKAKPLTEAEVIRLLRNYVPLARVAELAREEGIDFTVGPGDEKRLHQAGADAALIQTFRELASKAVTSQVQAEPGIYTFAAEPTTVDRGQPVTLRWLVRNATNVTIDHGIGKAELAGTRVVFPTTSKYYTLYARGPGGAETPTVMVEVREPQAQPEPVIQSFTAEPTTVVMGQSVTLRWLVSNATSVTIDPEIGKVDRAGSRMLFPTETTTYTLLANGTPSSHAQRVTVEVTAPPDMAAVTARAEERYASGDYASAATLYQQAAEGGNAEAMTNLGFMYQNGLGGLVKDETEAVRWYRHAAEAAFAHGMTNLGFMYQKGIGGLPKDEIEASRWYQKAAAAGDAHGMTNLGFMRQNGSGGLLKDEAEAVSWFQKAATAGDANGMSNLGVAYARGDGGLPKDETEAVRWYQKAAEAGDADGMFNLGTMYESGLGGLPVDETKAMMWYRKAAKQGNENATYALERLKRFELVR